MTVIDLLEKNKALLTGLISHSMLINESLKEMIGDTKAVNQNMYKAALGLKALAAEATKVEFELLPAEKAQIEQGDRGVIKDFIKKSSVTDLPRGPYGFA